MLFKTCEQCHSFELVVSFLPMFCIRNAKLPSKVKKQNMKLKNNFQLVKASLNPYRFKHAVFAEMKIRT